MHPNETDTLVTYLKISLDLYGLEPTCRALAEACRSKGSQAAAHKEPYQFLAWSDAANWLDKTCFAATIRDGMQPLRIDVEA